MYVNNPPKFAKGNKVKYCEQLCEIISNAIKFGNFYIYDLKELEFGTEFFGICEDEIKKIYK